MLTPDFWRAAAYIFHFVRKHLRIFLISVTTVLVAVAAFFGAERASSWLNEERCIRSPSVSCVGKFLVELSTVDGMYVRDELEPLFLKLVESGYAHEVLEMMSLISDETIGWREYSEPIAFELANSGDEESIRDLVAQVDSEHSRSRAKRGAAVAYLIEEKFEAAKNHIEFDPNEHSAINHVHNVLGIALGRSMANEDVDATHAIFAWGRRWLVEEHKRAFSYDYNWPSVSYAPGNCVGHGASLGSGIQLVSTSDVLVVSTVWLRSENRLSNEDGVEILDDLNDPFRKFQLASALAYDSVLSDGPSERTDNFLNLAEKYADHTTHHRSVVSTYSNLSKLFYASGNSVKASYYAIAATRSLFAVEDYQYWQIALPDLTATLVYANEFDALNSIVGMVNDKKLLSSIFSCSFYSAIISQSQPITVALIALLEATSTRVWADKVLESIKDVTKEQPSRLVCVEPRSHDEFFISILDSRICEAELGNICVYAPAPTCAIAKTKIEKASLELMQSDAPSSDVTSELTEATVMLAHAEKWDSILDGFRVPTNYSPNQHFAEFIVGLQNSSRRQSSSLHVKSKLEQLLSESFEAASPEEWPRSRSSNEIGSNTADFDISNEIEAAFKLVSPEERFKALSYILRNMI